MVEKTIVIKDEIVTRKYLKATHVRCDVCGKELEDFVYDVVVKHGENPKKKTHRHVCGMECFGKALSECRAIDRIVYIKVPIEEAINKECDDDLIKVTVEKCHGPSSSQIAYYAQKLYKTSKDLYEEIGHLENFEERANDND